MSYEDRFKLVDDLLVHFDGVMGAVPDPFLRSRYVGFLAVSVVTVFELAIKEILIDFAAKKHKRFGHFCTEAFDRMNGRVTLKDLKELHIKRFGDEYVKRFEGKLNELEKGELTSTGRSVKSSYGNLIVCRHQFAHQGQVPTNTTYEEAKQGYEYGKRILTCLSKAMVR